MTKGCGENRFVGGADNFLEFVITPDCEVQVDPIDSFSANVRMAWTMDEFYSTGGPTTFTDNVAGVMGIHSSQIKVVAVYEGSVVVDFVVEAYDDEEESDDDDDSAFEDDDDEIVIEEVLLTAEEKLLLSEMKLKEMIDGNDGAFGAPVLSASMDTGSGETEALKVDASWKPPLSRL